MTEQRPEVQLGAGEVDEELPRITPSPPERLIAGVRARWRGPKWPPFEIASLAIVVAIAITIVGSAAAAIVEFSGTPLGAVMEVSYAAQWADPLVAFALLLSCLASWHEGVRWCDHLEHQRRAHGAIEPEASDAPSIAPRSCALASAAFILVLATGVGSIASLVSWVIMNPGLAGPLGAQIIGMAGNILAVVVVAIACGVITARLRSRCRAALTV
jgi:hypothetical protein